MSAPVDDKDALLREARGGNRSALVRLLEHLAPIVRSRIRPKITRHLQSFVDEDDVMQVTYVEAVTRLETFRGGDASNFLAWLTRLAENNLIDAVRMLEADKRPDPRKRVNAVSPDDDSSAVAFIEQIGVSQTTPSNAAAMQEMKGALDRVLDRLPPDYATVVRLYDLAGRPIAEVASELGRSEGAVYMLRARAHDRLRDLLPSESRFFS